MSDYTAYVRGQREERGKTQTGRFMKDGFDRWAESSAPARVGQVEKEPAEATSTMREVGMGRCGCDCESEDECGCGMRKGRKGKKGGVLPLAVAAAPYVLPAAAGLATGIYAGVKGERKVQKMRQQIAREERAKRGGVLPLLPAAAVAAAPYVLPAAAGFATGVYAGVKGQRKVDQLRQQIAREERQKYSGMGFREGIRETQNLYGNMADAAISGYDAYEAAQKGFSGLPTALQKGADVASAISKATASAQKAAAEFQKGGSAVSRHQGYTASEAKAANKAIATALARQGMKSSGGARMDGRAARAAIVKQVMAQRGVSMIEASKIVKAEGLY